MLPAGLSFSCENRVGGAQSLRSLLFSSDPLQTPSGSWDNWTGQLGPLMGLTAQALRPSHQGGGTRPCCWRSPLQPPHQGQPPREGQMGLRPQKRRGCVLSGAEGTKSLSWALTVGTTSRASGAFPEPHTCRFHRPRPTAPHSSTHTLPAPSEQPEAKLTALSLLLPPGARCCQGDTE